MQKINVIISSQRYKSAATVFNSLYYQSIPYAVIKGEPLSFLSYGEYGKRHLGDIDLLVNRVYLSKVENILKNDGFVSLLRNRSDKISMLSSSHQISPYIKEIHPYGYTTIDVNFDVMWGEYSGRRIDVIEFLSDVIEMEIYGCKIKSLSPLKSMIQLILHIYKDMNSIYLLFTRKKYNIDSFKDVYYLLKNNTKDINEKSLYDICEKYSIIPYAYYVFYHVGVLYKDNLLMNFINALETNEGKYLLNCYGLNELERREWKVNFISRLRSNNLQSLIINDLSESDKEKIEFNRRLF